MEKKTILALALSFLVIGLYPTILQKFYPDYYKNKPAVASTSTAAPAAVASKSSAGTEKFVNPGAFTAEDDLAFDNGSLSLIFNKKDGGIREIDFSKYTNSDTSRPIRFISLKSAGVSPGALVVNTASGAAPVLDHRVEITGTQVRTEAAGLGGKLKVQKRLDFQSAYLAEQTLDLENTSDEPLSFSYELLAGSGVIPRHSIDAQYVESNFFSTASGKPQLKHLKENRSGKTVQSSGPVDWVAVKDRHFSVIVKPKSGVFSGLHRGLGANDFSASLISSEIALAPRSRLSQVFTVYIGPNELEPLTAAGLGDIVNFGKFDWIGKLCVGALELIQGLVRNYGLTVIALTTLINLLLFPLTRVSYMSMKRMQLIQPQITKLREHNKKNPEKLNREMMELYKKHKVNPFGGCLPMILQIPIFIALYVALSKYVPLVNAKFLWVRDLSSPDKVYLPFTLPFLGNSIHLLPLLMCVAMALQQKFTQIKMENQDPQMAMQQKMMAVMMPVIFGFIFYEMPSSLVLYWLTNTILMSLYQLRLKNMTLA